MPMKNTRVLLSSVVVYMALTGVASFFLGRTFSVRGFEDIENFERAAEGAGFSHAQTELLRSTLLSLHHATDSYVSSMAALVAMATVLVLIIPVWSAFLPMQARSSPPMH